jgi:hypothetical protein
MLDKLFKGGGFVASAYGSVAGWSDEFKRFYSSGYRCPRCNERLISQLGVITLKFYMADGSLVPTWGLGPLRAAYAVCPDCAYRFNLKADAAPAPPADPAIVDVVETERREEPFGTDSRLVDNAQSNATVKRTFTVAKQWTRDCSVSFEQASSGNAGVTLGEKDIASLNVSCRTTLTKRYELSDSTSQTYTETVEIDVPAATKLRIDFQWKKIQQCGYVSVREATGNVVQIPFSVVVGVTFDQAQVEEK